jgi:peptidoglycan/xylan/chitin deacetylase (PgdA/CDA1 family)
MAATLPRRLFLVAGPAGSRAIALTFDDGPHPAHTAAVLDRLRALGVRATFFVLGSRAEASPGLVRRMAEEGHAVGHHSWTHGLPGETSASALVAEARRTSALLEGILGTPPRLFRPPNGKLTPAKLLGLWSLGQTVVLWNRDPKDFGLEGPEPLRLRLEAEPISGGDVVLMHDVHPHVAPALDALVERVRALGLGFCTPDEWSHG